MAASFFAFELGALAMLHHLLPLGLLKSYFTVGRSVKPKVNLVRAGPWNRDIVPFDKLRARGTAKLVMPLLDGRWNRGKP